MKPGQLWIREIAPGVFRLGTAYVGCYTVEDAGAYTFVDTGVPGYWGQMASFLASRSAPFTAVKAVVLTHHHDDHRGNAERLRKEAAAKVLVHQDDLAAAMRRGKIPKFPLWKPRVLHYGLHLVRRGVARTPHVVEASGFADEEVLDVPGRPRVMLPPFANDDYALALASLRKIEPVNARWVLPGHGVPWEGSPQQAVKLARQRAEQTP